MFRLSVEGYSFHGLLEEGKMDIFHFFESLKYRYHIDAVGIWNGFFTSTEDDYIKKVKEALDEKEITVANLAVDWASIWNDDPEKRESNHKNALRHIRIAEMLGAKSVRIDWGVSRPELTEEETELLVKRYHEYCDMARDAGFVLGTENHAGASRNPHLMKKMIEYINHPSYKILLHAGSWYTDAEIGDEIVAPYAVHTHIAQKIVETCIDKTLATLKNAGYQGYLGVEHHSGKNEYTMLGWQIATVRRAVATLNDMTAGRI